MVGVTCLICALDAVRVICDGRIRCIADTVNAVRTGEPDGVDDFDCSVCADGNLRILCAETVDSASVNIAVMSACEASAMPRMSDSAAPAALSSGVLRSGAYPLSAERCTFSQLVTATSVTDCPGMSSSATLAMRTLTTAWPGSGTGEARAIGLVSMSPAFMSICAIFPIA